MSEAKNFPEDVNFTVLPFPHDVVQNHPEKVAEILSRESAMRQPIVVTDRFDDFLEIDSRVSHLAMGNLESPFTPSELAAMTSERAFRLMVEGFESSDFKNELQKQHVPIVTGIPSVQGHHFGFIDLDSRAAIVAATLTALGANAEKIRIKIFGEVPGVFSADPRIVSDVRMYARMSFAEALELSTLDGPRAFSSGGLMGVDQRGVQIQVRSIHDFDNKGTRVLERLDGDTQGVRFISGRRHQFLFTVGCGRMAHSSGIASLVLNACAELDVSVNATAGVGSTFVFSIDQDHPRRDELESRLEQIGDVAVQQNLALICSIGTGMKQKNGLASRLTGILAGAGVNIEEITTSADRIVAFFVQDDQYEDAINVLHREMIEREEVGR
jgi:aspartate kinase